MKEGSGIKVDLNIEIAENAIKKDNKRNVFAFGKEYPLFYCYRKF